MHIWRDGHGEPEPEGVRQQNFAHGGGDTEDKIVEVQGSEKRMEGKAAPVCCGSARLQGANPSAPAKAVTGVVQQHRLLLLRP